MSIDVAPVLAWGHLFVPGAGSEGAPKIHHMKMSPNAIPNNAS